MLHQLSLDTKTLRHLMGAMCLLAAALATSVASAAPARTAAPTQPSLAMHGQPALPENFTHFPYANPRAPKGGTLRLNVVGSFDSLNPFIIKGRAAAGIGTGGLQLVYETLLARSAEEPFSLYPLIAERITLPPDRRFVIFHLNRAARWHDGAALTAADVFFSWDILRREGRPNHRSFYNRVDKATIIDAYTIRFDLKPQANGDFDRELPLILGLMPILPQHWWQGRTFNATSLEPPLGSGPYRVSKVEVGRQLVFEKVQGAWADALPVNVGQNNFATIQIDYFRDENIAREAMLAGRYDLRREGDAAAWATGYPENALATNQLRKLELAHGRVVPMRGLVFNTRRPIFATPAVRAALAQAFDFDWLNKNLWYGSQRRLTSYFANSSLAAPTAANAASVALAQQLKLNISAAELSSLPAWPQSQGQAGAMRAPLVAASAALTAAGYQLQAGVRQTPQGQPFTFEIILNDPTEEKIALAFARNLQVLGINPSIRTLDSAEFQARLNAFDYDMVITQWVNSRSPGNEQTVMWSSTAATQPGSRNFAGVTDARLDKIIGALTASQTYDALTAAAQLLDRLLLWGHYMIPFGYAPADNLVVAAPIQFPATIPASGYVLSTLWSQPPTPSE